MTICYPVFLEGDQSTGWQCQTFHKWMRKTSVLNVREASSKNSIALHNRFSWNASAVLDHRLVDDHTNSWPKSYRYFFLSCTGLQVITSKGPPLECRTLQTPEPDFCVAEFGQTKQILIHLQPYKNIRKNNLVFQHMFLSSFNNGRKIGKLSNKSTSSISDTKSTSKRIACEGCKDVYGKNWTTSKVRLPWPRIAVPLVMLQDYPGPFPEKEWIKGYQINVRSPEKKKLRDQNQPKAISPAPNIFKKKHGLQCTTKKLLWSCITPFVTRQNPSWLRPWPAFAVLCLIRGIASSI